ncbi:interferon-gamma-inducible GTPase 10-like [Oculina patagonica]
MAAKDPGKDWESEYAKGVKEFLDNYGVAHIEKYFKQKLDGWQDVEVNIAVTGGTGVGKSSFINAIRGLDGSDNIGKRAKVGVTETTKELAEYVHPTNPKIKFWDLPGIGTPNYPEKTYCEKVKLDKFDAFLIFTSDRFKENYLKLAKKIKSIHKKFFFIRTKIDQDVRNEKHEKREQNESFNEDAM